MADDVPITAGTGTAIATDEIASRHFQRVKATWGADGTATDVARTAAAALPVEEVGTGTNAAGQTTVTNSSTSIIAARDGRKGVLLINYQTVPVYIDPSGGTATTSKLRLDPGAWLYLPVATAITGITSAAYTAAGDAKVHYAEAY